MNNVLRNILSGILAFFLCINLIITAAFFCVRFGAFKGNSFDEILDNMNAYSLINDSARDIVISEFSGQFGHEDDISKCIPDNLISDVCKETVDSLVNDEDADYSFITDYSTDISTGITNIVVDGVYTMIKEETKDIPLIPKAAITQNESISSYSSEFNIDVNSSMESALSSFPDEIDVSSILSEETKNNISSELGKTISKSVEKYLADNIDNINTSINKQLTENEDIKEIKQVLNTINEYLYLINIAFVILVILDVIFAAIIIFFHKAAIYKGLLKNGIAVFLSGLFCFVCAVVGRRSAASGIDALAVELKKEITFSIESITDYLIKLTDAVLNPLKIFGIAYIVLAVICFAATYYFKKTTSDKA